MSHRFNIYTDRPPYIAVPISVGLKWSGVGHQWHYSEKMDGEWCLRPIGASIVAGERMRGGALYAFDIPVFEGQDISREPLRVRLKVLAEFIRQHPEILPVATGMGGEFLEAVLANRGEGIVAKHLDSRYGELGAWVKCKRQETHDCRVTEKHPSKLSVHLELDGEDVGWCATPANVFARVGIGAVLEVRCHSRHVSGKLREPKLLRVRKDNA
jgi:hypothetical protein